MKTRLRRFALLSSCLLLSSQLLAEPKRPECIAPAKPGGGFDLTCKLAQSGLKDSGLLEAPMRVTCMPGGVGAVAYNAVVAQRAAEAGTITAFSSSERPCASARSAASSCATSISNSSSPDVPPPLVLVGLFICLCDEPQRKKRRHTPKPPSGKPPKRKDVSTGTDGALSETSDATASADASTDKSETKKDK